jgi:hypothetical protein
VSDFSKLISAIAALLWPLIFGAVLFYLRKEAREVLSKVPKLFDRIKSAKFAGTELILENLADKPDLEKGAVTIDQISVASQIEMDSKNIGLDHLLKELDRLCLEYDQVRRIMPSSPNRTREMTKILVKMRGLSSALSPYVEVYKSSGSPGSRLAAIAIMQMQPELVDIEWIVERFRKEYPFAFYHAALALANLANIPQSKDLAVVTARRALEILEAFDGTPDQDTVEVLKTIIG